MLSIQSSPSPSKSYSSSYWLLDRITFSKNSSSSVSMVESSISKTLQW